MDSPVSVCLLRFSTEVGNLHDGGGGHCCATSGIVGSYCCTALLLEVPLHIVAQQRTLITLVQE
jgi:hypothetical protein